MAHTEKYKSHSCGHMLAHYRRDPSSLERDNIDPSRTHLNVTFGVGEDNKVRPMDLQPNWATIEERIEKVNEKAREAGKRATRKDAVVMADIVVTLPENVPQKDANKFFAYTYIFIGRKVGKDNLLGGFVHRDEMRTKKDKETGKVVQTGEPVRDHMHAPFTPILDGSFNYKKMCPRSFYKTFHKELGDFLEEKMGYRPEVELSEERIAEKELSKLPHSALEQAKKEIAEVDEQLGKKHGELDFINEQIDEAACRLESVRRNEQAEKAEARKLDSAIAQAAESTGDGLGERYADCDSAAADALGRAGRVIDECQAAVARGFKGQGVPDGAASRDRALEARTASEHIRDAIPALRERLSSWRNRFIGIAEKVTGWGIFSKANRSEAKEHAPKYTPPSASQLIDEARLASAASVELGRGRSVPSRDGWSR